MGSAKGEFSARFFRKTVDFSIIYGKITAILQRQCGNQALTKHKKREGIGESPLLSSVCHFRAARDDRDGRSRYRAAKMSLRG